MSFFHVIEAYSREYPNNLSLMLSDGANYSYKDLYVTIYRNINWLVKNSLVNKIVVLDVSDPFEYICCFIASLSVGCTVLPLQKNMNSFEREQIIKEINPDLIVDSCHTVDKKNKQFEFIPGNLLHFTSGSFGAKKIVVRPYYNLENEAKAVSDALGLNVGDTVLITSPLSHSFGCGMMRAVIWSGGALLMDAYNKVTGARNLMMQNPNVITGVPYLYSLLLRNPLKDSLKPYVRCFSGGAHLDKKLAIRWEETYKVPLRQEYGLSEGGIVSFSHKDYQIESIGKPIPDVTLEIVNADSDGIGEIVVRRPFAPTKYFFSHEASEFSEQGAVLTGDLGYVDNNNCYYLSGRKKAIINVAGLKVNPREVEICLKKHPAVHDAVVLGISDRLRGERPVAFVEAENDKLNSSDILPLLKKQLSSHKVPSKIIFLTEFPRTVSGKIDNLELLERI